MLILYFMLKEIKKIKCVDLKWFLLDLKINTKLALKK